MPDKLQVNYAEISGTYDRHRSYSENEIRKIIRFAGIREGMRILDLGCGTGNVASRLLNFLKVDLVGVDLSLPMLKVAKTKSLEVIRTDAGDGQLPFRADVFNAIVMAYVIHQIDNLKAMFSECFRILKGGRLVLLTSSHQQIEQQHPIIKQFFPSSINIDKARFPDIPEVNQLLETTGFQDVEHEEIRIDSIPLDNAYLQKVKGKFVSTFHLLPQQEFEQGIARLEVYIKNCRQPEFRKWRGTLISGRKIV